METSVAENQLDRSSPLPKWRIGFTDFGIFLALALACMVVGIGVFGALARWIQETPPDAEPPMIVMLLENIGMEFGMLAGYLAFRAIVEPRVVDHVQPRAAPRLNPFLTGLLLLVLAYVAMGVVQYFSTMILENLGFVYAPQEPVQLVQRGGTTLEKILLYGTIVIGAPLCEEPVFRGGIFRYLNHRMPLYASAGISGLVFAAIHADIFAFAPLAVLGAVFAIAYRETGTLKTSIAMHAVFNSISLLALLLGPSSAT